MPSIAHKNIDVQRTIAKLSKNPDLKWRVESGLSQGFRGAALGRWLADAGFYNDKGAIYQGGSLSRFKAASEWMQKKI